MLGSPPPGPQPDPNAYYEWRGFVPDEIGKSTERGYGVGPGTIYDLNGRAFLGTGPPLPPNTYQGPSEYWRRAYQGLESDRGIWQQVPKPWYMDLESARRFQQQQANKAWRQRLSERVAGDWTPPPPSYPDKLTGYKGGPFEQVDPGQITDADRRMLRDIPKPPSMSFYDLLFGQGGRRPDGGRVQRRETGKPSNGRNIL